MKPLSSNTIELNDEPVPDPINVSNKIIFSSEVIIRSFLKTSRKKMFNL